MNKLSRRKWIAAGLGATAGAAGLGAVADRFGLAPPTTSSLYAVGETLTYASQRLLTRHSLAREFPRGKISSAPFSNTPNPPKVDGYAEHQATGFLDWRLEVAGMVANPVSLSIAEIRSFPTRSQITQLVCEEGWSYIAEWIGTPLSHILEITEVLPKARYVVYFSMEEVWVDAIDMADALHPQTLVVFGMNGSALSVGHGGPLRLRVPRQLGYKSVKYINRLMVTDGLKGILRDGDYSWYAGI